MTNPILSSPSPAKKERYWEIDTIRGICLIGTIIFHFIFIISTFHIIPTNLWENTICMNITDSINFEYIHIGTSLFVLICGFSLVLRQRRMEAWSKEEYYISIIKRGVQVLILGLIIAIIASIFIHFFIGDGRYMLFNLLMMMGCSMIICLPFIQLKKWAIIPAIIFIVIGFFLSTINGSLCFLPFGILPNGFMPRDYFPLLPWSGIMLLGFVIGTILYPNGHRKISLPQPNWFFSFLAAVGKHPLLIYVLHVPVITSIVISAALVSYLLGCPISPLFP